jgi:hypothetical protein
MKYAVEMGSGDIHAKFNKDWFRHSKDDGGGDTQMHRHTDDKVIS